MHFSLIDRVVESSPERLVAVRALSSGEEYLRDHFEGFPVMPGVLMVEAMVQACQRLLGDRGHDVWVLASVRQVRFASLVRPGQVLRVEVVLRSLDAELGEFDGSGVVLESDEQPRQAVSARLTLRPPRVDGAG